MDCDVIKVEWGRKFLIFINVSHKGNIPPTMQLGVYILLINIITTPGMSRYNVKSICILLLHHKR